jgi:phosphopantothenoylcysteine decarboxylase/phosphopantothenate--cysteine ligase
VSHILLGVSASVAVYKACDLASKLTQSGHVVRVVLTARAAELVAPQLFEAVTGEPAATTEYGPERRGSMDHIDLARWAEMLLVAPCTADLLGRLAHGLADDLLTTLVLAVDPGVPRLLCPAMNPTMLANPAVVRNLACVAEDGWEVVEPVAGHVACGEAGPGRLAEPAEIAERVARRLES